MATAAAPNVAFRFFVDFESRPDGGLRARSEQVPGFVLSHNDCEKVMANVEPVLTVMLSAMFETPMRVSVVQDLRDTLESAGVIAPLGKQEYVSHIESRAESRIEA